MGGRVLNVLRSPLATGDTSLANLPPVDPLLTGSNSGVRFLFDLAFGACYPGGAFDGRAAPANPTNSALVEDMSGNGDGQAVIASGQTVSYAGGGFDFTALTANNSFVEGPAAVSADLFAQQQFMFVAYVKLPSDSDWASVAAVRPFVSVADGSFGVSVPGIMALGMSTVSAVKYLSMSRQTSGATLATLNLTLPAGYTGTIAQVAGWRTSTQTGVSVRNATAGRTTQTAAVGSANADNFSAIKPKFGVGPNGWSSGLGTGNDANASNFRLYRGFVENLNRSGRDPTTVLDADWTRFAARVTAGEFS